jgi:hypothetical protein
MINSESMKVEEESGSGMGVGKHPDFEVNERCEVGGLLIVSAGIGVSTSVTSDGGFSDLSLRLKANFGFAPAEAWFVWSFSRACSHDFSCLNAGHNISDHLNGIE